METDVQSPSNSTCKTWKILNSPSGWKFVVLNDWNLYIVLSSYHVWHIIVLPHPWCQWPLRRRSCLRGDPYWFSGGGAYQDISINRKYSIATLHLEKYGLEDELPLFWLVWRFTCLEWLLSISHWQSQPRQKTCYASLHWRSTSH